MKRYLSFTVLFLIFLITCPAFGLDISVDIKGPQDLASLKDSFARTISARCLTRNVSAPGNAALNVSIFQMGSTLTFDAVLATTPPKAFHRDLKSADELSGAIDAMIAQVFTPAPPTALQVTPGSQAAPREARPELKLPFVATSMALLGETLFVSSDDTLYRIEDGKPKPWWHTPNGIEIFRLFPYGDAILAVTGDARSLYSSLIRDGKTIKSWNLCVVPSGEGLISSRLFSEMDLPDGENLWSKPEAVDGKPLLLPEGTDILTTITGTIAPAIGEANISFDRTGSLVVKTGKNTLWSSDEKISTLPLFVKTRDVLASNSQSKAELQQNAEVRYYLMPRILVKGSEMITIANHEGPGSFGRIRMYDSARIVAFTPDESELASRDLALVKNNYCADIALDKGQVLALIVRKSASYVQRIDVQ